MRKYKVQIIALALAHQWWGQQWCRNIENYADSVSRLERGRTYIRAGRVHEISIEQGELTKITTSVDGSMDYPYKVEIFIKPMDTDASNRLLRKIANLNAFKEGSIPEDYRFLFSLEEGGLFPTRSEIRFSCDCPDDAKLCKHIAAVLYGIGSILDQEPLLLFQFRGIDVDAYLDAEIRNKTNALLGYAKSFSDVERRIDDELISDFFGIDMVEMQSGEHCSSTDHITPESAEEVRTIIVEAKSFTPVRKPYRKRTEPEKKPVNPLLPDRMVIRQYELDGTLVAQFETYEEAAEKTGVAKRAMQRNVCGEKKSGGGFIWKKVPANTDKADIEPLVYSADPQKRPVAQFEYNGILVAEYSSIKEAARESGVNENGIRKVLQGTQKQAGGYFWEYCANALITKKPNADSCEMAEGIVANQECDLNTDLTNSECQESSTNQNSISAVDSSVSEQTTELLEGADHTAFEHTESAAAYVLCSNADESEERAENPDIAELAAQRQNPIKVNLVAEDSLGSEQATELLDGADHKTLDHAISTADDAFCADADESDESTGNSDVSDTTLQQQALEKDEVSAEGSLGSCKNADCVEDADPIVWEQTKCSYENTLTIDADESTENKTDNCISETINQPQESANGSGSETQLPITESGRKKKSFRDIITLLFRKKG